VEKGTVIAREKEKRGFNKNPPRPEDKTSLTKPPRRGGKIPKNQDSKEGRVTHLEKRGKKKKKGKKKIHYVGRKEN